MIRKLFSLQSLSFCVLMSVAVWVWVTPPPSEIHQYSAIGVLSLIHLWCIRRGLKKGGHGWGRSIVNYVAFLGVMAALIAGPIYYPASHEIWSTVADQAQVTGQRVQSFATSVADKWTAPAVAYTATVAIVGLVYLRYLTRSLRRRNVGWIRRWVNYTALVAVMAALIAGPIYYPASHEIWSTVADQAQVTGQRVQSFATSVADRWTAPAVAYTATVAIVGLVYLRYLTRSLRRRNVGWIRRWVNYTALVAVMAALIAGPIYYPASHEIWSTVADQAQVTGQRVQSFATSVADKWTAPAPTVAPAPTIATNQAILDLEARITDLDRSTPRSLEDLFPQGIGRSEWKEKAKAIHSDMEMQFAVMRDAIKANLDTPTLSPAERATFLAIKQNWSSETEGTLNWPFNNYPQLLAAIVPGGYRDEAPAVFVAYLQERLGKLRRLHGVLSP